MFIPMRKSWKLVLLSVYFGQATAQTLELNVVQSYESGTWQLQGDAFECRLSQILEGMANVSFIRQPGEAVLLQLELLNTEQTLQSAQVIARRADWQPALSASSTDVGESAKIDNFKALFYRDAGKLITLIPHGYWLDFELDVGGSPIKLTLTNIEGMQALKEYEQCIAVMSPLSWEQARHYEIKFATAQQAVRSAKTLNHLRDLVRYIELDSTIDKVLVDGHTDDVGNSAANRALSQVRADEVASRLLEFGLDPALIEVRAHGSRYPIVNNKDAKQGLNRRVSIRLIKHSVKKAV